MRHLSELLVSGYGRPVLCRGKMPRAQGLNTYEMDTEHSASPNVSVDSWMLRNVDFEKCWIPDCLLTFSVNALQAEDEPTSFLSMDDLNSHY